MAHSETTDRVGHPLDLYTKQMEGLTDEEYINLMDKLGMIGDCDPLVGECPLWRLQRLLTDVPN